MHRALTAHEVRLIEQRAVAQAGASLDGLMARAGEALATLVSSRVPDGNVAVLCGPGNNGGDGWVAARVLHSQGRDVAVRTLRPLEELSGPAERAAHDAVAAGVRWSVTASPADAGLADAAVIVDAILGTGSALPLREPLPAYGDAINASGAYVVAADLPTGVDSDTGAASRSAVRADSTVTFIAPKRGLMLYPGAGLSGEVVVADLGLARRDTDLAGAPEIWTTQEYAGLLPLPAPDAHKNSRGRLLIIAGSGRFPGAAVLAARGAMRSGAGYVTLAVPEPIVAIAQAHLLAVPVVGLPGGRMKALTSAAVAPALDLAHDFDAVLIGPGLSLVDGAVAAARAIVSKLDRPLVVDADALNALVDARELVTGRRAQTILTPHPGELARLLGTTSAEVQADRVSASARLAGEGRAVVLKGAGTVISGDSRQVINTSGSAALATAGTGDVLAGMAAAFLAQGLDAFHAGALAAYLHGRAGEEAAAALTPLCVTAEDVPEHIPTAVSGLLDSW